MGSGRYHPKWPREVVVATRVSSKRPPGGASKTSMVLVWTKRRTPASRAARTTVSVPRAFTPQLKPIVDRVRRMFDLFADPHAIASQLGRDDVMRPLIEAMRGDGRRVLVVFQPHLYSRTRHLAREFGKALVSADAVAVADVYPARETPVDGVNGKLVVDAIAELRPGMPVAWTPRADDGAAFVARRAQPGDRILTLGAGDVDQVIPDLLQALAW